MREETTAGPGQRDCNRIPDALHARRRRLRSGRPRRIDDTETQPHAARRTHEVLLVRQPIFPESNPEETKKYPVSETHREYRLWQAYSVLLNLQSTANRLLFKSCSPANTLKKNRLRARDNRLAEPVCRISPHPSCPRDRAPLQLLDSGIRFASCGSRREFCSVAPRAAPPLGPLTPPPTLTSRSRRAIFRLLNPRSRRHIEAPPAVRRARRGDARILFCGRPGLSWWPIGCDTLLSFHARTDPNPPRQNPFWCV